MRFLRTISGTVLFAAVLSAPARAGAADLAKLPANTWVRVKPRYVLPPSKGRHFPMSWNKLVYDSTGKRLIYVDRWYDKVRRGTIYANAVLAFDAVGDTVTCLKLNNWKKQDAGGGYKTVPLPENEKDPTPVDRHPYGCVAFVPEENSIYISGGANQTAPGNHATARDTWKFELTKRKWSRIKSKIEPPNGLDDCMAYDAKNKVIVRSC